MNRPFDVIVIGVGAMGAAACFHLARKGHRVLGLEQFGIPHALGSSHGQTRMIRLAYYEHPDYVPLLRRAYALWDELEAISGQKLLYRTGGIYIGPPGNELVAGSLRAARQHGLAHEALDRRDIAQRFPQFAVPDDFSGIFEPEAGFLLCERVISAYAAAAMRAGAVIHGHEPVMSWQADDHGVAVQTMGNTYRAQHLLFTAGAWTGRLVRDLGVEMRITRQVMGWVWPKRPHLFELGRFGVWAMGHADGSLHYGFPMLSDMPGMKIAWHRPAEAVDPDTVDRVPRPEDEGTFRPVLQRWLPDADGPLLSMRICLYTNSPDHRFILDRHPAHERVWLACGFSGHGFKFASVIGEALADSVIAGVSGVPTGDSSPVGSHLPIGFLGLERLIRR